MNIRVSAEDASWSIREAAWGFEEKVLWKGGDAAREALGGASERFAPLQRRIQTKLTWPLGDAYRARGRATRRAIATGAVGVALVAAGAGALSAAGGGETAPTESLPVAAVASATPTGDALVLQGVAPEFQAGSEPVPAAPVGKPSAPPARVAWQFSQAFVAYEVGRSSEKTTEAFAATASPQLAKALAKDPPRLPANTKVPQARVLNVVLGETTKTQITVSVSLVRMRAVSELRLTLQRDGRDWRVVQVLG